MSKKKRAIPKIYRVVFNGNKLNCIDEIYKTVIKNKYKTVYEPFGGSGCISVNLKGNKAIDKAVVNDYDYFIVNYENKILTMRKYLIKIFEEIDMSKYKIKEKLNEKDMETLQKILLEIENDDVFKELGKIFINLPFVDFKDRETYVKKCRNKGVQGWEKRAIKEDEYIEKIKDLDIIEHLDYKDFLSKYEKEYNKDSVLILDPPYLNSLQKLYKNEEFYGLHQTIELLEYIKKHKLNTILFNQHEKDMLAIMRLLGIENYEVKTFYKLIGSNNYSREEVMIHIRFQ